MNPRGYTWQKYLRTAWWRWALTVGFILVPWRGATREQFWYLAIMVAIIFLSIGWDTWQGWRSR